MTASLVLELSAVALSVTAFVFSVLAWRRVPPRQGTRVPAMRPTTHTHRIAAWDAKGQPLPDLYLGDDDKDVKRKWDALKTRHNLGHFELWHARHGKRASITRSL